MLIKHAQKTILRYGVFSHNCSSLISVFILFRIAYLAKSDTNGKSIWYWVLQLHQIS